MKFIKSSILLKISIIFLIFILDRISKIYVINFFDQTSFNEVYLLEFLNIYLIWNKGIAFGLMNFNNVIIYNIITLLIILITMIVFYFSMKNKDVTSYFFAMIFAGSLGNLFDRLKYSGVPDFIDFHIGNYHWFIFNVADIAISLGVICLILVELFYNKKL